MDIDDLKSIYRNLVTEELRIARIISEHEKEETYSNLPGVKGYSTAVQCNDYIKITVNRVPEKIKIHKEAATKYYGEIKEFWVGSIMYAIAEANIETIFDKCVVFIKIYYKDKVWDADNHHISFIVNAIRYSQLVPDDNFERLSYMVTGAISPTNEYYTEIYICSEKTFPMLYNSVK